jgi:hypothetical protein
MKILTARTLLFQSNLFRDYISMHVENQDLCKILRQLYDAAVFFLKRCHFIPHYRDPPSCRLPTFDLFCYSRHDNTGAIVIIANKGEKEISASYSKLLVYFIS